MQEEEFNVNVRKILATKAPKSKVPEFLIRYLEKIAHQDEINEFLSRKGHLHGIEFLEESIKFIGIELNVYGIEKIPEGRYTFAGNHPMGGIDGMSAGFEVYKKFPERNIMFLSNDILSTIVNLHPLFVPVNKVGKMKQDRSLPQRIDEVYRSDRQMVIFPAGKCARRQNGKITEQKWSKSFLQKSIETQRDIVPLYFEGQNSNFFYNLANIRSFFGIKTNRMTSNWFAVVGVGKKQVIVAGCQIHYACRSDKIPEVGKVEEYHTSAEHGCKVFKRPSKIYVAE